METSQPVQTESSFPAGLSQPALRTLAGAGIRSVVELSKFSEAEIRHLHGIGPNALEKLRAALADLNLNFAPTLKK